MRFFAFALSFFASIYSFAQSKTNPDISLNGLFTYRAGSAGNNPENEINNGFDVQELELRLTSNIDTYLRGDVILAVENENGDFIVEPEEAFVETLSLPDITIRAGKFYALWGRHNQLHTHNFPFIDAILAREAIFGEEGLNDTGVAVSYLVPTPWYFEIVAQVFDGGNEAVFGSSGQDDIAGVLFIKNLAELNPASTLELDLGIGSGDDINSEQNHIYNGSLTYKWRPIEQARTTSFLWTAEYNLAEKVFDENGDPQGRTGVFSTWLQYQFATRWWAQLRTEYIEFLDVADSEKTHKHSALIGYVPSEFSAIRLQYDSIEEAGATETENRLTLQLNVSLGTHPAHLY